MWWVCKKNSGRSFVRFFSSRVLGFRKNKTSELKWLKLLWDSYNPSPNIGGLQAQWWFLLWCSEHVCVIKTFLFILEASLKTKVIGSYMDIQWFTDDYDQLDFHGSTLPEVLEMMRDCDIKIWLWGKTAVFCLSDALSGLLLQSSLITSRSPFLLRKRVTRRTVYYTPSCGPGLSLCYDFVASDSFCYQVEKD